MLAKVGWGFYERCCTNGLGWTGGHTVDPANKTTMVAQRCGLLGLAAVLLFAGCLSAAENPGGAGSESGLKAEWAGNYKIAKYNSREFIVGVREGAEAEFPLIGTRTLTTPVYADSASPMTIQSQDTYVIYDRTKKILMVYNIAVCLKGKDAGNSEKTDWVGRITPTQDHWAGDIIFLRKYDKIGPGMKAPYYSMGRDYPIYYKANGTVDIDYDYFGRLTLKLNSREVKDDVLKKLIDDHDAKYREREPDGR